MDENARKRKREEDGEFEIIDGIVIERPREGIKPIQKKMKKDNTEKKLKKAERKKEKKRDKAEAKKVKAQKKEEEPTQEDDRDNAQDVSNDEWESDAESAEVGDIDMTDIVETEKLSTSEQSTTPSSKAPSPSFDPPNNVSGTSSISSVVTQNNSSDTSKKLKLQVNVNQEELRARLQKRIAELRAARKADNEDGTPARTRTELIEQRRKKANEKKANKKALRQQAKEEEQKQKELALARGSPLMSPSGMSPAHVASPLSETNNFSFGKIAFENGQFMSANLDSILDPHKKKGPRDVKSALNMAEKHKQRLAGLDEAKRSDIEEKDMWLNARKRAQGERIRDDTSLLKKALKRKENKKKKSEKEWNDRISAVASSQAARQKKREENLQKRREDKSNKGKKSKGPKKAKKKARPGFEGSFKTGGKGK
jgi:hypothetical protein